MRNPFQSGESPLKQIHLRSRKISQQNRQSSRSPAQNFRQYRVGAILQAIKSNHIIQKQANGENRRQFQCQRQRCRYLGIQSQRYNCPINEDYQNVQLKGEGTFGRSAESEVGLQVRFKRRDSELLKTMVNFGGQNNSSSSSIRSQQRMSYFSNYAVNSERKTSEEVVPSLERYSSRKNLSKENIRAERKCSIMNNLGCLEDYGLGTQKYGRCEVDRVREEEEVGRVSRQLAFEDFL